MPSKEAEPDAGRVLNYEIKSTIRNAPPAARLTQMLPFWCGRPQSAAAVAAVAAVAGSGEMV
jgi:hypothetical protein